MDPKKTTLAELIDAYVAADRPAPMGASALSRLAYWHGALGPRPVGDIIDDEVDAAVQGAQLRGVADWGEFRRVGRERAA